MASQQFEDKHPRGKGGRFATKHTAAQNSGIGLSSPEYRHTGGYISNHSAGGPSSLSLSGSPSSPAPAMGISLPTDHYEADALAHAIQDAMDGHPGEPVSPSWDAQPAENGDIVLTMNGTTRTLARTEAEALRRRLAENVEAARAEDEAYWTDEYEAATGDYRNATPPF